MLQVVKADAASIFPFIFLILLVPALVKVVQEILKARVQLSVIRNKSALERPNLTKRSRGMTQAVAGSSDAGFNSPH
jgi:hypothetical protein